MFSRNKWFLLLIALISILLLMNFLYSRVYSNDAEKEVVIESSKSDDIMIDLSLYTKPSKDDVKESLSEMQYYVTQEDGTEPSYDNIYWDEYRPGLYVDIVTGEPLFLSNDKYKSGTGWPSFTKPIHSKMIVLKEDNKLLTTRIEVRSKIGDSHLGHVFKDGPKEEGGLRYCMNSASLEFIPLEDMKDRGYEYLIEYVEVK